MKKFKWQILVAGMLLSCLLIGCGTTKTATEPTFEKAEKGMQFTAYAAPTLNKKVSDKLDEAYKKLAEAGFTKAIALYEGGSSLTGEDVFDTIALRSEVAEQEALTVLDLAEKYGIKYYVRDWSFYGLGRNFEDTVNTYEDFEKVISKMFDENNAYIDHPGYGGSFGFDEPNVQELDTIAWQVELYNKYIELNSDVGGEIFINLNPGYVADNSATLSVNLDYTYREYVDYYFEHVAPLLGYVCWDYYPFKNNGSENFIRDSYYYNLELMALKAKENDCEVRAFVQAKGDFTGTRSLDNIGDLRFQVYSNMAFGVRELIYYTYSSSVNETNFTSDNGYSLYDFKTDTYTWVYDAAKQVNNEVHAMEDAYMAYDWAGTLYKNASEMVDNQLFANLTAALDSHERMEFVSCTQDVMAGVFTAKDESSTAQDAFMIVNVTDPIEKLSNQVTVKFSNATHLLMYRYGEKIVVELPSDGVYTFQLEPGEGRFVIPF